MANIYEHKKRMLRLGPIVSRFINSNDKLCSKHKVRGSRMEWSGNGYVRYFDNRFMIIGGSTFKIVVHTGRDKIEFHRVVGYSDRYNKKPIYRMDYAVTDVNSLSAQEINDSIGRIVKQILMESKLQKV